MTTPAQIRSSSQVRKDFLDFFKSKQHTIVPSSSLMPDSPNLLFTNAGMNQFVPIFLGQTKCPYTPGRAADTQKCIRAGGKHNDLDDVGLDTYHHTFFEMLGNWSFGDYFKTEAIEWAWELVVGIWKFPPSRLYATVYNPDKTKNDPSEFDQDAWNFWAEKFRSVGLDPAIHIVNGNKKDNFWMMGETGPCGPCSELHVDLTPDGNTKGSLVNKGGARCIEIWNLVFIQFNANPDGSFSPLPAKHVDTGMGFERVTSIIQGTKGLTDFANARISNYDTDIFRPIFDVLEKMSGKTYKSTLPGDSGVSPQGSGVELKPSGVSPKPSGVERKPSGVAGASSAYAGASSGAAGDVRTYAGGSSAYAGSISGHSGTASAEQVALDIAFRVIADHIRTLSFAIADGIQPGNNDRNYVLRRILRRAVRYGRTLGFKEPFFYKLVDVLADTMGDVFPEIRARKKQVQETIRTEEEAFNKTLDKGIEIISGYMDSIVRVENLIADSESVRGIFAKGIDELDGTLSVILAQDAWMRDAIISALEPHLPTGLTIESLINDFEKLTRLLIPILITGSPNERALRESLKKRIRILSGRVAFILYDTYGFPLDLTELMARERGLTVDKDGFEKLMEEQRKRSQAAQKKEFILVSDISADIRTEFVGYDTLECEANVLSLTGKEGKQAFVVDRSPFYAEMGGQVGDTGLVEIWGDTVRVLNTSKTGSAFLLSVEKYFPANVDLSAKLAGFEFKEPLPVRLRVDSSRRNAIQRHHTVTHLLHWALHEVASKEASQKGSFVGPDKLTFDFNSAPLTPAQVADIEKLVNERILENAGVSWTEVAHADVKHRKDVMQFFGDKYGDTVRVVQIGGHAWKLDGYSMELCGGTHTRATGEIGLFRIVGESAIAAGVRRIEAVAGLEAYRKANDEVALIKTLAGKVNSPVHELDKKIEALLAHQKELEKQLKSAQQREASNAASLLLEEVKIINGIPVILHNLGAASGDFLQAIADSLKGRFKGVIILGGVADNAVALLAAVSPEFVKNVQAGKIIQQIAPIVGGRGGGKPDNARGGGKDATKLDEALAKAKSLLRN
jgi:alanyl-tRNA synthetase